MTTRVADREYVARSVRAYEQQLRDQIERYGRPEIDAETAGRRAAVITAAGQAWARDAGPFYDTAGARAALGGVSKQAVSHRVATGHLLGLRLAPDGRGRRDRLVYPAWQFHPQVLRLLPTVLDACGYDPQRPVTGWTIAAWLTTADPRLGGMAPVRLLRAGSLQPVLDAAHDVAVSLGSEERAAARAAGGAAGPSAR